MPGVSAPTPASRDRQLRRVRAATWAAGAIAAALAAGLSVAAAHAFKGHDGTATASAPARSGRVRVPPAQDVPAIAGDPLPLQPPAAAPTAAPPQPEAETSGGS